MSGHATVTRRDTRVRIELSSTSTKKGSSSLLSLRIRIKPSVKYATADREQFISCVFVRSNQRYCKL